MALFEARCTLINGKYINPDQVEIFNVDNPSECYPAARNQFRVGQVLTEEEFRLEEFQDQWGEYQLAFRVSNPTKSW